MKQEAFSKYVFKFLEESFPAFIPAIKYHKDGSFDCDLRSPSAKFAIWIATYNQEITFGIEAPDGKTDIHTHISCDEIDDLEDCLDRLAESINDIKDNKVVVYLTATGIYDWIDYKRLVEKETGEGKVFQKYFWSGRS